MTPLEGDRIGDLVLRRLTFASHAYVHQVGSRGDESRLYLEVGAHDAAGRWAMTTARLSFNRREMLTGRLDASVLLVQEAQRIDDQLVDALIDRAVALAEPLG